MKRLRITPRALVVLALAAGATLWAGCSDLTPDALVGPGVGAHPQRPDLRPALAVQMRHTDSLLRVPGVVGTAVGLLPDGRPAIRLFLSEGGIAGLPAELEGIPVTTTVTGMFMARSDPTQRARPAPMGYSVGHPQVTAGSIGARVVDGAGHVYVLSNNHVLANSNDAAIGDPALQPGAYDGGVAPADQIGTLAAFNTINFSGGANSFDAAIALTTTDNVANTTPLDDGYGAPSPVIYGDANGDGQFDDKNALLGLAVEKYGRTTKLTHGTITGINATVSVCYEVLYIFCIKQATFVDQLIIEPGTFSGGGDSGSLIVTDDGKASPVGLLFAGSSSETIANRIDLVLSNFGVHIDGGPPPAPVTDLAVTGVTGSASVTQGATANISVTVTNVGNQTVGAFPVTLKDATDNVTIGTRNLAGLGAGAAITVTIPWNTTGASIGAHTLTATQGLADDNAGNDQGSLAVTVSDASLVIHVGDLDGAAATNPNGSWGVTVTVTVHDAAHNPLSGAAVTGHWSLLGTNTINCTTGAAGTCTVSFPSIKRSNTSVNMTVVTVTYPGRTYDRTLNHDPGGDSNGTTIKVLKP
ncbi:MAG TPA: CARDB domain-containing protein [Gemmatimonadales bacterium]|nr:CARDB domain-containing protein [Gemmatimonadales bacterium]